MGCIPFFLSVTEGMERNSRKRVIKLSVMTAILISITFVFVGKILFGFLGIEIYDFMIAGGAVLFLLSVADLLSMEKQKVEPNVTVGVVPIGTPLLSGPAVLATALICLSSYGYAATIIALVLNLLIAGVSLHYSNIIIKLLGKTGSTALSKIMALVLAAYAVMMIRGGVLDIISKGLNK
jgi:multiple antibiotic resistance protein